MTDQDAKALGARGEDLAVRELRGRGLEIVDRNWRSRTGEIDIVAVEVEEGQSTAVFCEVKCRAGTGFGDPLEAITWTKVRRLRGLASEWVSQRATHADGWRPDAIRLDAIGVIWRRGAEPQLRYVRGIG